MISSAPYRCRLQSAKWWPNSSPSITSSNPSISANVSMLMRRRWPAAPQTIGRRRLRTGHHSTCANTDGRPRDNMAPEHSHLDPELSRPGPGRFGERAAIAAELEEVDAARAQEYALISALLARAP